MTRGDFLGFGILGTIVGAILTIPPAAFVLGPLIDIDLRGQSDIPDDWFEVGSISEISEDEPKYFLVEFPVEQIYSQREIQEKSGTSKEEFTLDSGLWVSWKTEILEDGKYGSTQRPSFLDEYDGGSLSEEQVQEAQDAVNVFSARATGGSTTSTETTWRGRRRETSTDTPTRSAKTGKYTSGTSSIAAARRGLRSPT
jgi:hypothetical protein